MLATDEKQITVIYNSRNEMHKRAYAYLQGIKKPKHFIDTAKSNLSTSQWGDIVSKLNAELDEIIDNNHEELKTLDVSTLTKEKHDYLKILDKHPEVIKPVIAIDGEQIHLLENPYQFQQFITPDSENISRDHLQDIRE